jgi:hypothetical protein
MKVSCIELALQHGRKCINMQLLAGIPYVCSHAVRTIYKKLDDVSVRAQLCLLRVIMITSTCTSCGALGMLLQIVIRLSRLPKTQQSPIWYAMHRTQSHHCALRSSFDWASINASSLKFVAYNCNHTSRVGVVQFTKMPGCDLDDLPSQAGCRQRFLAEICR